MKKNIKLIPLFLFLFVFQLLYFLSTIYTEKIDHMFLILAVFIILICILLYCVLSDVLKKSNTEMELACLQKQKQLNRNRITVFRSADRILGIFRPKLYRNFRISRYFWNRENMNRLILRSEI